MRSRFRLPFRVRLRTNLLLVNALTLLTLILAGSVVFYLTLNLREQTHRALRLDHYSLTVSQAYLELSQTLLTSEEVVKTRDAYLFQQRLLPRLTSLSQSLTQLDQIIAQLDPDDPLRPYFEETRQLLHSALSTLTEAQRLAREGQWPSVQLRILNLHSQYTQGRVPLSTLLSQSRQAAMRAQLEAKNLLFRILLLNGGVLLFLALTLMGQASLTLSRVVVPLETLTAHMARFAAGDLGVRAPEPPQPQEIKQLAHTFNQMADQIQSAQLRLEQEVEARTAALHRRTAQLKAAAEIGRAVTAIQDVDELLNEATRLIADRFEFYHVGIFLLDASGEYAVLRAANSPGGQRMLRRGHRLKVGEQGIVGYVTATGRPRIALDVGADAVHFHNPDLPHTRSEAALPLRAGGKILGALDVQSVTPAAFSQDDLATLQLLADLLATAIYNANLLQESREAVQSLERAYAQLSRQGWAVFTQQRPIQGYRVDLQGRLHPLEPSDEEEGEQAEAESPAAEAAQPETLTLPIEVRGFPVARLRLHKYEGQPWTLQERRLVQELSRRLGAALDAARLYAEAQRRAAQLQAAAEIARDASSTLDLEALLANAVELIRDRFGFYHASVFLIDESGEYAEIRESTGEAGAEMKRRRHRLAVGSASTVGQATATGRPVVINDTRHSDIHRPNPLLPETRAELALPLKAGEEIIGALDVQSRYRNAFSEEDIQVLQILADQLAVAVVNARLFAEIQAYLEAHRGLHQVLAEAASAATVAEAFQKAAQALHAQRPDDLVLFFVPEDGHLRVAALAGHAPEVADLVIPIGQGITGWVAQHRQPQRVNQVSQDPRYIPGTPGVQSELTVPLIYRGELLGLLDMESFRRNAYSESDQELFFTLATSLAAVLANLRLLEATRRRSQQLQMLNEISAIAAAYTNQVELLQAVLPALAQRLGASLGSALLPSPTEEDKFVMVAHYPPDILEKVGQQPDHPLLINAHIHTLAPLLLTDFKGQLPPDLEKLLAQYNVQSILLFPLVLRQRLVGVLRLGLPFVPDWDDEDVQIFEQLGRQIATSLETARLFEQAVRRAERERLVTEITTRLRASNDPQVILQTAVREIQRALRAETTQVVILEGADEPPLTPAEE